MEKSQNLSFHFPSSSKQIKTLEKLDLTCFKLGHSHLFKQNMRETEFNFFSSIFRAKPKKPEEKWFACQVMDRS